MPKNSEDYWREREEEQRKHNITDEREYRKNLERIYKNMLSEVSDQIYSFYAKYANKEGINMAEAKRRANKLDIEAYAEKAKKYVKEKDFSDQVNEEMRIYNLTMKVNRLELLKAQIGLELCAGSDEIEKFMAEQLEGRTLAEIERQAGILGKSIQNNKELAKAIVNASFHNATFSDRIWAEQASLRNQLSTILQNALIAGRHPREFIPQIRKIFDATKSQANRLLVTEMARVQTEAQMQSFKRNGFDEYTFLALGTACEVCRKIDGHHFKVEKANAGVNMPPMHPHCRCSTSAYMDDEEYEAWLNSYKDHGLTWDEWKKRRRSGALSGAWNNDNDPYYKEREKIAKELYKEIGNRKKIYEVKAVSKNSGLPKKDVERVYDHIFVREHLFSDGSIKKFDPDYYMAHSWQRLREGKNIQKHDLTMLYHELEEEKIMGSSLEIVYEKAHEKAEAKYNYHKDLLEYLKDHDV